MNGVKIMNRLCGDSGFEELLDLLYEDLQCNEEFEDCDREVDYSFRADGRLG